MSKRMTEAAKLYWKDIDVLEEARSELVEYFDSVWSQIWERIGFLSGETDNESDVKIENYQDRQRPGRYSIILKQGQPANFEIVFSDPRRSDDWRFFNVKILCNQAHRRKLDKLSENARTSIETITSSHGVDIKWDKPKNVLYKTDIEVVSDDAGLIVDRVVEVIEKMIEWITEAYSWMLDPKK
jgi:hypothetical protein